MELLKASGIKIYYAVSGSVDEAVRRCMDKNLIILKGEDMETKPFVVANLAYIDKEKRIRCGKCETVCRFDAVRAFEVDPLKCEGCGACTVSCPSGAINMHDEENARSIVTETDMGMFSRAETDIGAEGIGQACYRSVKECRPVL